MQTKDKEILVAKIDTLRQSIGDPLIDTILTLLRDTITSIETNDPEMGFTPTK